MNRTALRHAAITLAALLSASGQAAGQQGTASPADSGAGTTSPTDARSAADSAAPRALNARSGPAAEDTSTLQTRGAVLHRTRESDKDTAAFALAPLWGLDVAWTLGGSPAFDIWQKSLPRSLANLALPAYLRGVDGPGDADSARLRFELKDEPNTYNVDFPVGLSWAFLSKGLHGLSANCAFAFERKHASAVLRADSVAGRLTLEHSLATMSLGAGLTYTLGIPEKYFSVDNTRRTALAAGVSVTPLTFLRRRESLDASGDTDDSLLALGERVSAGLHEFSAYGWGISWTVGVSSVKKLSATGGLITTVAYHGRWQRFSGVVEDDLRYMGRSEGTPVLSYVCHRFALMLSLVRGRRPRPEGSAASAEAVSPSTPPEPPAESAGSRTSAGDAVPAMPPKQDAGPGSEQ